MKNALWSQEMSLLLSFHFKFCKELKHLFNFILTELNN